MLREWKRMGCPLCWRVKWISKDSFSAPTPPNYSRAACASPLLLHLHWWNREVVRILCLVKKRKIKKGATAKYDTLGFFSFEMILACENIWTSSWSIKTSTTEKKISVVIQSFILHPCSVMEVSQCRRSILVVWYQKQKRGEELTECGIFLLFSLFTFQKKISLGSLEVKRTKNNQCVSIPYLTFGQLVLLNYPDDQTLIIMDVDFRDQEGTGDRSAKEEPPVLR